MKALNWLVSGWRDIARVLSGEGYQARELARITEGLDLVHRADGDQTRQLIEAPDERRCPCCRGRHCFEWRRSGHQIGCGGHTEGDGSCYYTDESGDQVIGCGGEGEPVPLGTTARQLTEHSMASPGHHTIAYLARHAVAWGWNPIPLRTRVILWPTRYAAKLGRQMQVGGTWRVIRVLP